MISHAVMQNTTKPNTNVLFAIYQDLKTNLFNMQSLRFFLTGIGMQVFINMNILNATHKLYISAFFVSHCIGICWILMIQYVNTKNVTTIRLILTLNMGNALGTVLGIYLHGLLMPK